MTHKLINRLEKRRASRKMHSVPHSLLLTSYFLILTFYFLLFNYNFLIPKATAQQSRNPIPDTECQCGGGALTPTPTNAGTNFLLCFEENTDPYYQSVYSADGYLGIYCASMGDLDTVTITCNRYPNFSKVFVLEPNATFSYDITGDSLDDLWIVSDESVDNRVVQVHSTAPIVCYGLDYKRWSADAFCALPQEYSGTEY